MSQMDQTQYIIFTRIVPWFELPIIEGLKQLLEEKHLYQSIEIHIVDASAILDELKIQLGSDISRKYAYLLSKDFQLVHRESFIIGWKLYRPSDPRRLGGMFMPTENAAIIPDMELHPGTLKLFCTHCDRIEPYNYYDGVELSCANEGLRNFDEEIVDQTFALSYQCQSCKGIPEVFLIRRQGMKITLTGRSPIEHIEIPKYIPPKFAKYISDAILAKNCGQLLPGVFMLRTFIEQYIRSKSKTPKSDNIEGIFTEYGTALPEDFKQRFPSLKSIYDRLSVAIHDAIESEDIFTQSLEEIYRHFDAIRLYSKK
jgi:hypothetical protein